MDHKVAYVVETWEMVDGAFQNSMIEKVFYDNSKNRAVDFIKNNLHGVEDGDFAYKLPDGRRATWGSYELN